MNEVTRSAPDIVDIVTIDGEEYMRYKPIPLDYVIIRGTYVDEMGNLTTDEEAMQLEVFLRRHGMQEIRRKGDRPGQVQGQERGSFTASALWCRASSLTRSSCVRIRRTITGRHTALHSIPPTAAISKCRFPALTSCLSPPAN